MKKTQDILTNTDPAIVSETALKVLHRIALAWGLSEREELELLGESGNSDSGLSDECLERISCIFGVYKSLRIFFPTEQQANSWVKKPNREFDGRTALSVLIDDPFTIRRYLDGQLT